MRSMYRVCLVIKNQNNEYKYENYKELLAEDEEDAVFRWALIFNFDTNNLKKNEEGQWSLLNDVINVELAYLD